MGLADESHAKELRRCFEPIIFGVTFDPIVGAPSKLKLEPTLRARSPRNELTTYLVTAPK